VKRSLVLSAFNADTAAATPGPDWLRSRRIAAAGIVVDASLPSVDEEVWRYSRIADLDLDAWTPATGAPSGATIDVAPLIERPGVLVTAIDGAVSVGDLPSGWAERGVVVAAASTLDEAAAGLGSVASDPPDVFSAYNDAFLTDAVVVTVPRGVVLDEPIVVHHHLTAAGIAVFPRLVVRVADGASATVVDRVTSDDAAVLSVPLVELDLAPSGRLRYLHVQELGPAAWQIGSLIARVGQEADLSAALVGLGGEYARLRTDVRLSGRGANGDLTAAYFGEADQTLDFRTFQHHDARDTTSNLLFKGAVGGRSRSVYTGLIRVDKEARGTNAFQTNRNIKLSDEAWAESVPNLEIETNDVHCSHASTVGPVDPEQHFYLESRGVPPRVADRLIVAGFFDEVLRALPAGAAIDAVRASFAAKLDRVSEDLA
jgi:Fe-S cluster assembly protein SufD